MATVEVSWKLMPGAMCGEPHPEIEGVVCEFVKGDNTMHLMYNGHVGTDSKEVHHAWPDPLLNR